MRQQEVQCFAQSLHCPQSQIEVFDLLQAAPTVQELGRVDGVLLGGSGDYSVAAGGPWLEAALLAMQELFELSKPTFASCWGFQAMARALGGRVVTDPQRAEIGSLPVQLTAAGEADPLFSQLGSEFLANMGHQDIVDALPPGAQLLASSDRVENQAFTFAGKPIYCTQFHPELDRQALMTRLRTYPQYVERIAGVPLAEFEVEHCVDTPQANSLLARFWELVG